jgi:hypothetical protein
MVTTMRKRRMGLSWKDRPQVKCGVCLFLAIPGKMSLVGLLPCLNVLGKKGDAGRRMEEVEP